MCSRVPKSQNCINPGSAWAMYNFSDSQFRQFCKHPRDTGFVGHSSRLWNPCYFLYFVMFVVHSENEISTPPCLYFPRFCFTVQTSSTTQLSRYAMASYDTDTWVSPDPPVVTIYRCGRWRAVSLTYVGTYNHPKQHFLDNLLYTPKKQLIHCIPRSIPFYYIYMLFFWWWRFPCLLLINAW